ncbi:hypothetical protein [Schlesneria paludicola]|uniref:hypothetical protein n=1 Tax=Schlesneria paludicola TaxID=360056 RepID=UPI00138AB1F3|nr:hypothetical protein [Schlesneria paludicola]
MSSISRFIRAYRAVLSVIAVLLLLATSGMKLTLDVHEPDSATSIRMLDQSDEGTFVLRSQSATRISHAGTYVALASRHVSSCLAVRGTRVTPQRSRTVAGIPSLHKSACLFRI